MYDRVTRLIGADRAREILLQQAALRPHQRVLDVGCGTGTLPILIKREHPQVEVVGLDPDPKALKIATRKANRAEVSLRFDRGFADALPYPEREFDAVLSSFMFHHLDARTKEGMFAEVHRVLKPGGRLHLVDFSGPEPGANPVSNWFHSRHRLKENSEAVILSLMASGGLVEPRVVGRRTVMFGLSRSVYYSAAAPAFPPQPAP